MIKVIITQTPSHSVRTTFVEINEIESEGFVVEGKKQQQGNAAWADTELLGKLENAHGVKHDIPAPKALVGIDQQQEKYEDEKLDEPIKCLHPQENGSICDENKNNIDHRKELGGGHSGSPDSVNLEDNKDKEIVVPELQGEEQEQEQADGISPTGYQEVEALLQVRIPKRPRTQRNKASPLDPLKQTLRIQSETNVKTGIKLDSRFESDKKKRSPRRSILRRPDMVSIDEATLSLPLMSKHKKQKPSSDKEKLRSRDAQNAQNAQKQKPKQQKRKHQSLSEKLDCLYGCSKCDFTPFGCENCNSVPVYARPKTRWVPEQGRPQIDIPSAPTFRPTAEEFADPIAYVSKITAQAAEYGVAHIIPPKEGWDPPFALDKGTNGIDAESFRFKIRRQLTSHLCYRMARTKPTPSPSSSPEFGFTTLEKEHTLKSFTAYADWIKSVHFSDPSNPNPSVEEIEAEFWRIVESEDSHHEALYGQDLDSGHHGSGFPLPEWRRRLLEEFLETQLPSPATAAEELYANHSWNVNNMPRCESSMLRYLDAGDGLITGVMVPWLYVGSCMSAFCWHVEDHALYSVNYLHVGSPKVWYAVPARATTALEEAMKDALPHLFEASPNLMHQLVTMLSPNELSRRGVPVYKVVHEAGSFVVTMPNAYHSGFNTGFNVAEAVNFAAPDWLPFGTDVVEKYRCLQKPVTMSYDSLLVALVRMAEEQAQEAAQAQKTESREKAFALATGELALRAKEEKERWARGLAALESPNTTIPIDKTSAMNVQDCAECKCDLWLAAVVSPSVPGIAVCPEHAASLVKYLRDQPESASASASASTTESLVVGRSLSDLKILCRYTPDELQRMVDLAVKREEDEKCGEKVREAIGSALERRAMYEVHRTKCTPRGPLYSNLRELGCPKESLAVKQKNEDVQMPSVDTPPEKKRYRGRPKKKALCIHD
jgi:hypothetical protein